MCTCQYNHERVCMYCSSDIMIQFVFRETAENLKKVVDMLLNPDFDSEQVDPDLHKIMNKAVEMGPTDGRMKCFNMRESNLNGDQDLLG